ncbi:hypothetical protein ACXJY6_01450 [Vibrio sp. RC27]
MKKWLFAIALIAVFLGLFTGYFTGSKLDDESRVYAERAIPAISRRFDSNNFLHFASSQIKERYSINELDTMMNDYTEFGDFVEFTGLTGKAARGFKFWDTSEHSITAKYQAYVEFEEATTVVEVELIKSIRGWSILEFKIYPIRS